MSEPNLPPGGDGGSPDMGSPFGRPPADDGSGGTAPEGGDPQNPVPPADGNPPAGDPPAEPFHKEGEQVFKTKEEYIAHVNRQRGAASRLAHDLTTTQQKLSEVTQALERANATAGNGGAPVSGNQPAPAGQPPVALTTEEQAALDRIQASGRFATATDLKIVKDLEARLNALDAKEQQQAVAQATQVVEAFFEANPNCIGREADLNAYVSKGLSLEESYTLVFGEKPKPTQQQNARTAYQEGKNAAVRQAQAGGGAAGNKGGHSPSAPAGSLKFDWGKLRE